MTVSSIFGTVSILLFLALFFLYTFMINYFPYVALAVFLIQVFRYRQAKKAGSDDLPRRKQRMILWGIISSVSAAVSIIVLTLFADSLRFM